MAKAQLIATLLLVHELTILTYYFLLNPLLLCVLRLSNNIVSFHDT